VTEFSGDITNPTGIAFDNSVRCLLAAGWMASSIASTPFKEAVPFARALGVATGIAFDSSDIMFVGDRSGMIYKVNGIGEESPWAQLEPSVSAYHLAFGPRCLFVCHRTDRRQLDSVMRVNPDGEASVFYKD